MTERIVNVENKLDDYPVVLKPKHVFEILDIGKNTGYTLFQQPDFPCVRVGKNLRVSREAFRRWLEERNDII